MYYGRSCFLSRCVTSIQKIVSHIRSVIRGALVQIARCVYVTRTRGKLPLFLLILGVNNDKLDLQKCDTKGDCV